MVPTKSATTASSRGVLDESLSDLWSPGASKKLPVDLLRIILRPTDTEDALVMEAEDMAVKWAVKRAECLTGKGEFHRYKKTARFGFTPPSDPSSHVLRRRCKINLQDMQEDACCAQTFFVCHKPAESDG